MERIRISVAVIFTLFAVGCGGGNPPENETLAVSEVVAPPPAPGGLELDPDDPTILIRPFTAEQIRDEWVPGLRLLMRRTSREGQVMERWTVIEADDDGVQIEYAVLDQNGHVVGEPRVQRSGFVELRDHARFPVTHSTREWVARTTQLGEFEGWLYRVAAEGTATVQEFFFVPESPGAPVQMRILEGDTTVFELEQTARLRSAAD